jgi:hypothetical protein
MKKRSPFIIIVSLFVLFIGSFHVSHAALYETIWSWPSGPSPTGEVDLSFTGWDPYYVDTFGYRVAKFDFELDNSSSTTFYGVNLVLPFVWGNFSPGATPPKQAYNWDNSNQQWINDYVTSGNVDENGLYVKVYSDPNSPTLSYIPINQTDIPLTAQFDSTYEQATIGSTDSVPAWLVDSVFNAGESVNFSIYLEYERRSTETPYLSSLWIDPYVTAVPIPGAVWMLGSGLIGLVFIRRKFTK